MIYSIRVNDKDVAQMADKQAAEDYAKSVGGKVIPMAETQGGNLRPIEKLEQ